MFWTPPRQRRSAKRLLPSDHHHRSFALSFSLSLAQVYFPTRMIRSRTLRRQSFSRERIHLSITTSDASNQSTTDPPPGFAQTRQHLGFKRIFPYCLGVLSLLVCLRIVWTTSSLGTSNIDRLSLPFDAGSTCLPRNTPSKTEKILSQDGVYHPRQLPVDQRVLADPTLEGMYLEAQEPAILEMRWPPLVTAIPEVQHSAKSTRIGLTTAGVDAQFCFGQPHCRFLLPLWIGEQESRGRIHLTQLVHLAAALNRTLVLPNVGKSRLGACGKWSFETYYDMASMAKHVKEVSGGATRIYLMDDFKTWVDMRPDRPRGQFLFLYENTTTQAAPPSSLLGQAESLDLLVDDYAIEDDDGRLKNAYCLKTKLHDLSVHHHNAMSLVFTPSNAASAGPQPGDDMASLLQSSTGLDPSTLLPVGSPDVLLVHWELRHLPFITTPSAPTLTYTEKLWNFAPRLTNPYGPYLAIHWRMETVDASLLSDCAEALVDTLTSLLGDPTLGHGIGAVWLATDVPWSMSPTQELDSLPARSNTFKTYASEHDEAVDIVKAAFGQEGPLHHWKLVGLDEEVERLRVEAEQKTEQFVLADEDDDGLLWRDSGVWGILDKIVAMRSALFVSSVRECGKVRYAGTPLVASRR